jgi:phosphate transport system substrate-binding protein
MSNSPPPEETTPEIAAPESPPQETVVTPATPPEAISESQPPESPIISATPSDTNPDPVLFRFTRSNFPRLDGSTSMIPLGEAIVCVLLGIPRENAGELIDFSKTTQAYCNLIYSYDTRDLVIATEPDWEVVDDIASLRGGTREMIEYTPIAVDSLVFIVNLSNPIDNLTIEQIQKIYTGEITNWKQVGGDDVEIAAFQRNTGSGSQTLMEKLVMQELPLASAPSEYTQGEMGGLIAMVKSFDRTSSAIGYTVYYYANDMKMAEGLKILSVDGVMPSDITLANGEYPLTNPYFAAIRSDAAADSPERILYNWLLGDEGRELIRSEGYVPVGG